MIVAFFALSSSMVGCDAPTPGLRDPCRNESDVRALKMSEEACEIMRTKELTRDQKGGVIAADARFKSGGQDVLRVALKIAAHEPLEQTELTALGSGIDQSYPHELPENHGSMLLYQALRSENLQAVEALLQAGASPYAPVDPEDSEFKFRNYISMVLTDVWVASGDLLGAREDRSFPHAVLQLYLKYGGDPDYSGLFGNSPLLGEIMDDIGAFTMLLDHGASPWFMTRYGEQYPVWLFVRGPDLYDVDKIDILFARGYYDNIKISDMKIILSNVERIIENSILKNRSKENLFYKIEIRYREIAKQIASKVGYEIPRDTRLYYLLYESKL